MSAGKSIAKLAVFGCAILILGLSTPAFASETVFGIDRHLWSSFWRVANFFILLYLLNRWLKEPVKQFFRNRLKAVTDQFQELEEQERKLSERQARQNELFSRLDSKINEIRSYYEQLGKEERDRLIKQAEELKRKTLEDARIAAEREFEQAKKQFREEVVDLAVELAEHKIRQSIGYEDHQSLIMQYVEMLESGRTAK